MSSTSTSRNSTTLWVPRLTNVHPKDRWLALGFLLTALFLWAFNQFAVPLIQQAAQSPAPSIITVYTIDIGPTPEASGATESAAIPVASEPDIHQSHSIPPFLHPTYLDVEGKRMSNAELVFTIEQHVPDVKYELDFGDGSRTSLRKRTVHAYQFPGEFIVTLLMTYEGKTYEFTKDLYIHPKIDRARPIAVRNEEILSSPTPNQELAHVAMAPMSQPVDHTHSELILEPWMIPQNYPQFPGGEKKLIQYIRRNAKYPRIARNHEVEGTVLVKFDVSDEGILSNIKVVKSLGFGLDEEAIRLVKAMPKWRPAMIDGNAVNFHEILPFTFKLLSTD
ncbi:TonB family protein [Pontibacter sp. G13]|uniref:TonB family protein n=1 Tax=Pontibacter sp. G13 TaxID=3074898 RepID=UPI00288C1C7D|nr:TonB family protein [Pontibacter sp. G13]WNJ16690.1 TonB family protein [Pontibacter sp. G13]